MDDASVARSTLARASVWPLLVILTLAIGVRVWVIARSEVAARDSIGYIRYALSLESEPFVKVLREAQQPPGYAVAVMVASWPVRAIAGGTTGSSMALSAEVASAFFGVLLILPMVWLGEELVSRRVGLIAAALFQCLPAWVRITSDGLTESTFLFWAVTTLWLAARAYRLSSWRTMLGGGLTAGCAYFTRPEGAELVVMAAVATLLGGGLGLLSWRTSTTQTLALAAGFAVFLGPFYAVTGRLTNKPTARYLLGDETAKKSFMTKAPAAGPMLAVWWQPDVDQAKNKWLWSAGALIHEVSLGSRVVGFFLSIAGWYLWPRRSRNTLGSVLLAGLMAAHACVLIRMTSLMGYLSERHTGIIVLGGCFPAALAIDELVTVLVRWRPSLNAGFVTVLLVVGTFTTALPSLAKPMHGNRAGHRAAGEWLAVHAAPSAAIRDPFCWANYYAGRDFHETAAPDPDEQYVVLESADNQHSRLPLIPEAKAKAATGELVFAWPATATADKNQVRVYRWLRPATAPNASRSSPPAAAGG